MIADPSSTSHPDAGRARWHAGTVRTLRAVVTLHALAVFGQALSAGLWLGGTPEARMGHLHGARAVMLLGLLQVIVAVLHWRRGAGPSWPTFSSLGLLVGEIVQFASGVRRAFAIHVPLGVLIFAGVLRVLVWVWTTRPPIAAIRMGAPVPDAASCRIMADGA